MQTSPSPIDRYHNYAGHPILSPISTLDSGSNPRSPLKRSLPEEVLGSSALKRAGEWQSKVHDPVGTGPARERYMLYDNPRPQSHYDLDAISFTTESSHVPKIVEAEYRRLADTEAAWIPEGEEAELLTPAIWKEHFIWPNPRTTTQCTCLMHYFIEKLAPWVSPSSILRCCCSHLKFDVGDPKRTFCSEVPRRASRCPPLLNAIFTLAARHLALFPEYKSSGKIRYEGIELTNLRDDTCVRYHQASIAYLKELAKTPEYLQDENLLACAVILRYYEELDCALRAQDLEPASLEAFKAIFRAQTSSSDASLPSPPAGEGWKHSHGRHHRQTREHALHQLQSFQHACFRIALRQETTTAFMKQRSINLPLCSTWSLLDVFEEDAPDFVWADRHLHHCAKVLHFCFGDSHSGSNSSSNPLSLSNLTNSSTHQNSLDRWRQHKAYQEQWEKNKPLSFSPFHFQDSTPTSIFPKIWFMSETHVIGLQYLNLARILLTVYDPGIRRLGTGSISRHKRADNEVREIVTKLCGISLSNPSNQPARMQAFMAVAVCGERFEEQRERRGLLQVLEGLEGEFGWPTGGTRDELKMAWGWK